MVTLTIAILLIISVSASFFYYFNTVLNKQSNQFIELEKKLQEEIINYHQKFAKVSDDVGAFKINQDEIKLSFESILKAIQQGQERNIQSTKSY